MQSLIRALLLCLLLPVATFAQTPQSPVLNLNNSMSTASGGSAARSMPDRAADWINPRDYGAIADGTSHPLSSRYSTLAAAQAICPEATALTQQIDWCAMQAAIDHITAQAATAGVQGTPGGRIKVPAGASLKLGTTLVASRISLTIAGDDQYASAILAGANPMLAFGLSNGMGAGSVTGAASGAAFAVSDTLVITGAGGTCEDNPIATVATVGPVGEILTATVTHAGSCSVVPPNPLGYSTSGVGYGAALNGTWTGSVLTSVATSNPTGTGCVNGETLTAVGGSTPGGTPTPLLLTITNAVAGQIQKGGVSITNPGAYGTPPPNPVAMTGSAACVGASFNIGAFTNSGGALTLDNLQLVADAPGVSAVKAQFNMGQRSTVIKDLLLLASGSNYWGAGFDLTSVTNGFFQRIDTHNNLTYVNSNPSAALFVVRQQNNLLGHFEHYWDHINAYAFTGGAIDYLATASDTVPYQGLKFTRIGCAVGMHCLRLENASTRGYGNVLIDDLYATQTVQQIEIALGLGVVITNSNFGIGTTRMTSLPSSADMVVLDRVNQWTMRGNICASAVTAVPTITCVHAVGTSSFGIANGNIITNAAKVPTFTGYVFDSGGNNNLQTNDYFGAHLTPVTDSGTNNTTVLTPPTNPACLSHTLVATETYTIPNNTPCVYFANTLVASATIIMPVTTVPNQQVRLTWFGGVTTLTVQPSPGQSVGGAPTTSTQATPFTWQLVSLRWQRI